MNQEVLTQQLKKIFPKEYTLSNVRKDASVKFPVTGAFLEFDLLLPGLNLCFEFQDTYHYVATWYNQNSHAAIQQKDIAKNTAALLNDLTLIEVPCWWDGSSESLVASINFYRPDLGLVSRTYPIPFLPRHDFFPHAMIAGVGELMLASFPTDPKFSVESTQKHWWIGEKYDGIRCCWNAKKKVVYTRSAKELSIWKSFANGLPGIFLDLELWFGRGQFSWTYAVVNGNVAGTVNWSFLRLLAFDAPALDVQKMPFEKRYHNLLFGVTLDHPFCMVAPRMLCKSDQHLTEIVKTIIESGGEGIILRAYASLYDQGRSPNLMKLKTAQGDMEGIVKAIYENKSILLTLPNDQTVTVPPEDVHIPTPNIGDVVTFSYLSQARRDKLVDPKIFRIRTDVLWEDVVLNYNKERKYLNDRSIVSGFTSQPLSHWTKDNMRAFLETFANSRGMDPLLADTWYSISARDIRLVKGGNTIMGKQKGGYLSTLKWLFPEIHFDSAVFHQYSWRKIGSRKQFFEKYAREMGFDPHIADNWYVQPMDMILSAKGASSVLFYHKHSVSKALLDLFPEIGLEKTKFRTVWNNSQNRRKYFENFAQKMNFDPLVLENWTLERRTRLKSMREAAQVLFYHSSVSRALLDLFPELELDKSILQNPRSFWHDVNNRKLFFENYAKKHRFDARNPENWYIESRERILAEKGARRVLSYYRHSVADALLNLFPEVNFEKARFAEEHLEGDLHVLKEERQISPENVTSVEVSDRRRAFEDFARNKSLDPHAPETWYSQSKREILADKDLRQVLSFYRQSITSALLDLFPEISLSKSKLKIQFYWCEKSNRRKFFERFALDWGFDALNPQDWYAQPREKIASAKGANGVLHYYNHSVSQALLDLFPEIGLESAKFRPVGQVKYLTRERDQRRAFLENYAKEHNFNARDPAMWQMQSKHSILATKGASKALSYYNYNVLNALLDLFPDIACDNIP